MITETGQFGVAVELRAFVRRQHEAKARSINFWQIKSNKQAEEVK